MNRFSKENKFLFYLKKIRLPIIAFLILFILFFRAIDSVDETTSLKQQEQLTRSLVRSITQCYAIDGSYPPSLDYIRENYGLTYDENNLFIDYQFIGANIYPDITIIVLDQEP